MPPYCPAATFLKGLMLNLVVGFYFLGSLFILLSIFRISWFLSLLPDLKYLFLLCFSSSWFLQESTMGVTVDDLFMGLMSMVLVILDLILGLLIRMELTLLNLD